MLEQPCGSIHLIRKTILSFPLFNHCIQGESCHLIFVLFVAKISGRSLPILSNFKYNFNWHFHMHNAIVYTVR